MKTKGHQKWLFFIAIFLLLTTGCAKKSKYLVSISQTPMQSEKSSKVVNFTISYCINDCKEKWYSEKLIVDDNKPLTVTLGVHNPANIDYKVWRSFYFPDGRVEDQILFSSSEASDSFKIDCFTKERGPITCVISLTDKNDEFLTQLIPITYRVRKGGEIDALLGKM